MADIPMKHTRVIGIKKVAFRSIAALITLTLLGNLFASCRASNPHQPAAFSQMRVLVTPNDPAVQNVLAQALAGHLNINASQTSNDAVFNLIRDWVPSHIEYISDEKAHDVEDYWQSPAETLVRGTGDCEDYAILLVSLLRAYGVPEDQVYVAVGYEINDQWHAWAVERYFNGIWRVLTVEVAGDASYLDSGSIQSDTISYCFNDRQAFQGLPKYPPGYTVPELPPAPTTPAKVRIRINGMPSTRLIEGSFTLTNPSYDEAKSRMGRLYLPASLPDGYYLESFTVKGNYSVVLFYANAETYERYVVFESTSGVDMTLPAQFVEEVTVRGTTGYLIYGSDDRSNPTSTPIWREDVQVTLFFPLDGWVIHIAFMPNTTGVVGLIKIAESLQPY